MPPRDEVPIERIRKYVVLLMAWYGGQDFSATAHWAIRKAFTKQCVVIQEQHSADPLELHDAYRRLIEALEFTAEDRVPTTHATNEAPQWEPSAV